MVKHEQRMGGSLHERGIGDVVIQVVVEVKDRGEGNGVNKGA